MNKILPQIDGVPIEWLVITKREDARKYVRKLYESKITRPVCDCLADTKFDKLIEWRVDAIRRKDPVIDFLNKYSNLVI